MFQLCKIAAYFGIECQFESNHGLKNAFSQHFTKNGISNGTDAEIQLRYAIFAEKDAEIKPKMLRMILSPWVTKNSLPTLAKNT